MNLLPYFTWIDGSFIGHGIRDSIWLFPFLEASHLLGLAVIGGSILLVNMRLLGLGLGGVSASHLAREVQPWLLGSLAVMLLSGFLLFTSEAVKLYDKDAFWYKMAFLAGAMLVTFTVQNKAVQMEDAREGSIRSKAVAVVALLLWTGVGISGRWIGFS